MISLKKRIELFSLALLGFIFSISPSAYSRSLTLKSPSATSDTSNNPIYLNTNYSFRERAADLVSRMTLAEEVAQFHTNNAPAIPRLGIHEHVYGSESQHGIDNLHADFHHGKTKNPHRAPATSFPVNFAAAMTWDPKLMYQETTAISDEARGFLDKSLFGVGQNNLGKYRDDYGTLTYWAPTINMDRDPRWGRTDEAFGEDPFLASRMAAAWVDGFQGETINGRLKSKYLKAASTAKHYALYNVENNRFGSPSNTSHEAIRDYYTATFAYLIKHSHLSGIMTSYNAINGTPAVANTYTINLLAKRTYGFDGYTTADCGAVGTVYHEFPGGHFWAPPGWRTVKANHKIIWINEHTQDTIPAAAGAQAFALRAGSSMSCWANEYTLSNIKDDIKAGILSKGVIDRALTRVLTIRMRTGAFDPPSLVPYTHITKEVIQDRAHQKLAEKVAENDLVLLKDKPLAGSTKRLLPLHPDMLQRVLILGNLADKVSLGSYFGDPSLKISAVKGITEVFKKMNPHIIIKFDSTNTSTTSVKPVILDKKIKSDIRRADVVIIFIGTNGAVAWEGHDRASLAIPGNQENLINKIAQQGNKNMILVMQSDGPMNINFVKPYFPAILFSGYNGEAQGFALANGLIGKKNPSGHLDFTWYRNDGQLPNKINYYLKPGKTKGLGRTYQYFTKKPLYPFGYGLSYTKFKYSDMSISRNQISPNDSVRVSFDVTNTGDVPGASVAQLYVAFPKVSGVELPIKELEGFKKTKILKPGEAQHISLKVKAMQLKRWNEHDLKDVVYNGSYQFQLGKSSGDIVDSQAVNIQGKIIPKATLVTVEPENLVFKVGDKLDLKGQNEWIKSDVVTNRSKPHLKAAHIVEAVNNDGTFIDPSGAHFIYKSNNNAVAKVSGNGIIQFVAPGVVTITATIEGILGSAVFVIK